MTRAAIVGIAGATVSDAEAALLRAQPPAGIILFGRNVADPAQLAALTASLRGLLPDHAMLMVDQEGGRVARMKPPHWRALPPAGEIGRIFAADPEAGLRAAWVTGALIGVICAESGFDVACAPVLDLRMPGAHDVIGDRAYAEDPDAVARLGRAVAEGLLAAGIQPVGKHAPGHGRARADSHLSLPVVEAVDLAPDFVPFIRNAGLPWMMTAHLLYRGLDPDLPATLSATDHRRGDPRPDRLRRRAGLRRPGDAGVVRDPGAAGGRRTGGRLRHRTVLPGRRRRHRGGAGSRAAPHPEGAGAARGGEGHGAAAAFGARPRGTLAGTRRCFP